MFTPYQLSRIIPMPLVPERVFDPTKPVVARRFFVAAGRHFNPGDVFDWKRSSVDQRRVRLLFDAGKIMHPEPTLKVSGTAALPISIEVQDDDIHHIAVTAAAANEQPTAPVEDDGLHDLGMKELRGIAAVENAPFRVSREAQRDAIREARRERAGE
jgi:hypothetical protein